MTCKIQHGLGVISEVIMRGATSWDSHRIWPYLMQSTLQICDRMLWYSSISQTGKLRVLKPRHLHSRVEIQGKDFTPSGLLHSRSRPELNHSWLCPNLAWTPMRMLLVSDFPHHPYVSFKNYKCVEAVVWGLMPVHPGRYFVSKRIRLSNYWHLTSG